MTTRREFLQAAGAAATLGVVPWPACAAADWKRLLILVELKGGNDGLNTVVPFADAAYARLRPRIGMARDAVLQLDAGTGLHPSLAPLMPLWQGEELAVVQSVGYPQPNLSHFRSIEIWDTASKSDQYLREGWLARAFAAEAPPRRFVADGVVIGAADLGPLTGARAVAMTGPDQFQRLARLAQAHEALQATSGRSVNPALQHLLAIEGDVASAAVRISAAPVLRTAFPAGAFGDAVKSACEVAGGGRGVAALRLSLSGFDTHHNQSNTHANLLRQLAEGLVALRAGLTELGRWNDTLVMTYAEFGRRPRENQSGGTDHGTAAPHFVLGGCVRGGLYGEVPKLDRLDGNGNLPFSIDYRSLYATVLEKWWGVSANAVLGGKFAAMDWVRG